ncbi:MAG: GGDEF domain-containing protein [Gloeomargaritaceae cyanobacterium C42_A2020_066]|nr:GGDEF domain-containing protein [Gloeomargaritaceae cyanobacterium C42_A2020_066]
MANRALFYDRRRHGLAQAAREHEWLAVIMLDMDGLKPINDTYGHRAGDAAIQATAGRLATVARHSDTVARLGGDEFALILAPLETQADAEVVAQRLRAVCNQPVAFEGQVLPTGVSLGIAIYPEDGLDPGGLVDKADQAMYATNRQRKAQTTAGRDAQRERLGS